MLTALFVIALLIVAASWLRPPTALWQRGLTWLGYILMLAVAVAWTLEYLARSN